MMKISLRVCPPRQSDSLWRTEFGSRKPEFMGDTDHRRQDGMADRQSNRRRRGLSAVTAAFIEHQTFLKKFLTRYFVDGRDIDDVAQEAYLRAYAAEKKNLVEQPKAFLFRIAKNVALTELSRKSRQITDYIEEAGGSVILDAAAAADLEAESDESLGLYCEAVAKLPENIRQAYLLRKVHGLSHKAIAERLGVSVSSVEKYLRTGVLACREYIARREGRATEVPSARDRRQQTRQR